MDKPDSILIVDDDPEIRRLLVDYLARNGFEAFAARDGREMWQALDHHAIDLVVLDLMLPDTDGLTLCRDLRALSGTLPIIFLTARDSDFDTVSGLRMGADDYVTKNMSLPHLLARVSALFRRADLAREPAPAEDLLTRGPLQLDLQRFSVSWSGREVELTLTEFWMVHALAKHPGHVKNRDQLMSEVHIVVDDSTITSHVKRIRRKFAAVDPAFDCIDTVYGLGYRWRAEAN